MSKPQASMNNPNVLAAVACLGGFWWFLHRVEAPKALRWATWW